MLVLDFEIYTIFFHHQISTEYIINLRFRKIIYTLVIISFYIFGSTMELLIMVGYYGFGSKIDLR
jgi:hypothetical protein